MKRNFSNEQEFMNLLSEKGELALQLADNGYLPCEVVDIKFKTRDFNWLVQKSGKANADYIEQCASMVQNTYIRTSSQKFIVAPHISFAPVYQLMKDLSDCLKPKKLELDVDDFFSTLNSKPFKSGLLDMIEIVALAQKGNESAYVKDFLANYGTKVVGDYKISLLHPRGITFVGTIDNLERK